ncbi:hypothetical protein [Subtercola boreus]|uniref:Uncharacterized protein n=1 Tax=Subtercola boreus TaxID=120213 RepID=A0A3E0W6A5_9MICO|nr:hypothetical protein [Subtercola boreus]RFA18053.1 hypothetical protein B7R24_15485 [Subtercola boreus]RFA18435.1 hypothetical protein B7R23_15520 [Subtercola boreus]RFA24964.1 hypothetical protein B7R25_15515 [Subtercola boreus]
MKVVHFAGGEVRTGDDIADAVIHYAEALARRKTSAAVEVPALLSDGSVGVVSMLLGPASQLVAVPEPGDDPDVSDATFIVALNSRAALLGDPKPVAGDTVELGIEDDVPQGIDEGFDADPQQ